jgi:hypothetical protein
MASNPEELGVEVEQLFVDTSPVLSNPPLPTVLVGEHFQIEESLVLGTYAGALVVIPYPDLIIGAVVEQTEVVVSIVDPVEGTFSLVPTTEFTVDATSVTVLATAPGIMERTVERVDSDTGAAYATPLPSTANFVDAGANFIVAGVKPGDRVLFDASSVNTGLGGVTGSVISAIIDANSLLLADVPVDATGESYVINNVHSLTGEMLVGYRARRNDLVGVLKKIERRQDIASFAGTADPLNPLGLAAALHENAAPGNSLFITALAADDATSHVAALDNMEEEDVYSVVNLHQNDEVLDLATSYEAHVDDQSQPENKKFRITLQSRTVPDYIERQASQQAAAVGDGIASRS